MGELLLELLSEEIPARMQRRAIADLSGLIRDKLAAAEIAAAMIRSYVTPRRLVVIAEGIAGTQPDRVEERRGPRVGAPTAAIDGFLRAAGLASLDDCEIRDTGKGAFYFGLSKRAGRPTIAVLPTLVGAAISELPWPKSMRYPAMSLRWVRPLRSVICLFDGAVVGLALDAVPVGRMTRGHRFLAPDEITVENAADYVAKIEAASVVLDADRRRAVIADGLEAAAAAQGLTVKPDPALLDEVTGLVEFPVVLMGAIGADFMTLPPEVLATAMRAHQKYFSVLQGDGTPAPHFLFVANNRTADGGATIVAGNERVLRARLSDARFFWDQDRKIRLEDRIDALKQRVFHARIGTMYEKTERVAALAAELAESIPGADPARAARAARAARLAKADLSTGMVGEFPELQGVMGRYYALNDGEDPAVATAIADHYKPLGPGDACPAAPDSIAVALADKIDTLAAFFAIDEKPTGSRDPFALRRAALGIIRIIVENKLRLKLTDWFGRALNERVAGVDAAAACVSELLGFVVDRLKVHLREQGIRHDHIAAVFATAGAAGVIATGRYEDDLVRLITRVEALKNFLTGEDGANLLIAYRRAANIVAIEERKDGRSYDGPIDRERLLVREERALADALATTGERAHDLIEQEDFEAAMAALAELRRPVDAFFNKVTVNDADPALRENRLRLLSRIRATLNQVADFSLIEG